MAAVYGSISNIWDVSLVEVTARIFDQLQDEASTIGIALVIVGTILGPLAITANAIVITAIWKDPYKQLRASPSNIIIASMACSDFLVGVVFSSFMTFAMIINLSKEYLGHQVHQAFIMSLIAFIGLSVLHVFALTIDRVIAVIRPLRYRSYVTKKRVLCGDIQSMFYSILALLDDLANVWNL
ncbi:Trace amine-associated receptor 8 [Exaiptasia diaphana]|nr:Trace amine-associated receptor 8 [Exaiptasia diaphana]